ncbi:MAG: pyrimidine/purine nucleoside phosphorylase [Pseudomonadota bacterium]
MSEQFDNVTAVKRANVYFDGKCISHTVLLADGSRKTLGVILPSLLTFDTGAAEIVEINAGKCRIRLKDETEWVAYEAGQRFNVGANSSFEIETIELLDYVCHFV